MITQRNIDARILELSNTVSDLLVGLKCLDRPEVEREARRLKDQANEYGVPQLGMIAHNIERAAITGNLNAAQQFIPELHERLQQARESMHTFSAQSPSSQRYASFSFKG